MTPRPHAAIFAAPLIALFSVVHADEKKIDEAQLESDGVVIGKILLEKSNIFDLSDERENNALYRLINKLHIMTKDNTIEQQLLLQPGETYSQRLVDESERILRSNSYLYDASIEPVNARDGVVDLKVSTRDVWTFKPGVSFSRKGGENDTGFDIEEINLLGYGQRIRIAREDDVDRDSKVFEFRDSNLGNSWVRGELRLSDNSDGHSNFVLIERPFYALDTRWSLGGSAFDDDRRTALYSLGDPVAEYQQEQQQFTLSGGHSSGLQNGWVRRYRAGLAFDEHRFAPVIDGTLPAVVPENRKFVYPFIGIELLEDQFETGQNIEQIGRTEDFYLGERLTATIGYASKSLDSDRSAIIYAAEYSRGFGSIDAEALIASLRWQGRLESGDTRNSKIRLDARYYYPQSKKHTFLATLEATIGHDLDVDSIVQLGGDTGLRGYPLRYQSGESKLLFTMEQRVFWDWYPWRLFRVGGAVFADVGRTWGNNPVAEDHQGWLKDVGIGLRFASTRVGFRRIVHLDVSFPLDGDDSIDDLQITLESKRRF